MKRHIIATNSLMILTLLAGAVTLSLAIWVSSAWALAVALMLIIIVVVTSAGKAVRMVAKQQDNLYAQTEALMQLNQALNPRSLLPSMRGYAGSPDFLVWLYREIKQRKPKVIVEASSGVSTLVCGYALEQLGEGRVVSLEHHEFFAGISRNNVEQHQLQAIVNVCHAPLKEHTIEGASWQWYDFDIADLPEQIDMLVIDGPPRRTQSLARYPALPLLKSRLAKNAVIFIDDAARADEKAMVKRWKQEFPNLEISQLPAEKGLTVIRLAE